MPAGQASSFLALPYRGRASTASNSRRTDQHPDAAHPFALLRTRRERPRRRRAAKQSNDLPPVHCRHLYSRAPTCAPSKQERPSNGGAVRQCALQNPEQFISGYNHVRPARPMACPPYLQLRLYRWTATNRRKCQIQTSRPITRSGRWRGRAA